jgi:hypothetical protein
MVNPTLALVVTAPRSRDDLDLAFDLDRNVERTLGEADGRRGPPLFGQLQASVATEGPQDAVWPPGW